MPRVLVAFVALAALNLAACTSGTGDTRTIQVDFNYDEFAGSFIGYFPRSVTVRPGMTVKFNQTWTGAPHSVTFADAKKADELPRFFRNRAVSQDAAQPCFVKSIAELPLDHAACAKADQVQPEFTGAHAYYSSGLIQSQGKNANTFVMKIAPDAKPGTYFYYCNVHGVAQSGHLTISKSAKVASQKELNTTAREEATQLAAPVLEVYKKERAGEAPHEGNLAGSGDPTTQGESVHVNEFTPHTIYTNRGAKVTWTFVGNHSISFNTPRFTPLFKTLDNGDIVANDELDKPAGGWPGAPPGHQPYPITTTELVALDAGSFDGSGGLKSSGIGFNTGDTYSVTFTKKGTFPYACLIHPGMIGKVVVK
jgi:plastocyanin